MDNRCWTKHRRKIENTDMDKECNRQRNEMERKKNNFWKFYERK